MLPGQQQERDAGEAERPGQRRPHPVLSVLDRGEQGVGHEPGREDRRGVEPDQRVAQAGRAFLADGPGCAHGRLRDWPEGSFGQAHQGVSVRRSSGRKGLPVKAPPEP
jgi:hypothetical protein